MGELSCEQVSRAARTAHSPERRREAWLADRAAPYSQVECRVGMLAGITLEVEGAWGPIELRCWAVTASARR